MFYALVWVVFSTATRLFLGLRTYGRRNVPTEGGVILAVDHQSFLDPVIVECGITRAVHFMSRETLFRGVFGKIIWRLNAFPVERGGADRKAVREFVNRVRDGGVVLLFPEGTRTRDGLLGEIRPGVGALAVRAGAVVVPTYIAGTFDAWPRDAKLPRMAHVSISFGRPISIASRPGESNRARQERISSEIASRLRALEARSFQERRFPRRAVRRPRAAGEGRA